MNLLINLVMYAWSSYLKPRAHLNNQIKITSVSFYECLLKVQVSDFFSGQVKI